MTVHTVEVDKVGHKQAFLVSMSFQFANKKIHIFPIICRMITFRKVDMSINIVLHCAGDPRRERAGHYRAGDKRRAVAVAF